MKNKGLSVNMGKTNVTLCGRSLNTTKPSGKYPCSVFRKGVGRNFCKKFSVRVVMHEFKISVVE